jgi:conjugative transposon TraJ protein
MKKTRNKAALVIGVMALALMPAVAHAQGNDTSIYSLHHVLENLYDQMMPLFDDLVTVGRAIAGFGALWFIAYRVWGHIARAEPIDFYPLLRPFAIGLALILFPALLNLLNGALKPVSDATAAMGQNSQKAIAYYIEHQEEQAKETPDYNSVPQNNGQDYSQYEDHDQSGNSGLLSRAASLFSVKAMAENFVRIVFQFLYEAAGLCIDVIRTFYLIVLSIIGPLVLGLSVFDGFQHTFINWLTRYIHVYMWLPVANIFGAITSTILENMFIHDQNVMSYAGYIIFMIIAVVGYATVPSVTSYIVHPSGRDSLLHKSTDTFKKGGGQATGMAKSAAKAGVMLATGI